MGHFNLSTSRTNIHIPRGDVQNFAGGDAFAVDPRFELAAIFLTSFLKDGFYRSGDATQQRLEALFQKVPPIFAAKAAVYARTEHGLRSISHVAAAEVAKHVKGEVWTQNFFNKVFHRPDDMAETLACYQSKYGRRPIPNSLKKGIRKALTQFGDYQLAKYRGEGKAVKLVDLVNLVHPKGPKGNDTLTKLVKGELKLEGRTWEAKLSEAGKAETQEEKDELKGKAWKDLLSAGKLGYLAALRNVRNIVEQAPEAVPALCKLLVDESAIKKGLIFPFQFLPAMAAAGGNRAVMDALVQAIDLSLGNVPRLEGKTLVALDDSGSMGSLGEVKSPFSIASLFAAALYKANDATLVMFSDTAKYHPIPPSLPIWAIVQEMGRHRTGAGTNFHCVFQAATVKYDRIIFLSDCQGWVTNGWGMATPEQARKEYARRVGKEPKVYSFDVAGLGTIMFPERSVYCLAGVSDKTFEVMKTLEEDPKALISRIEAVRF